jgi:hypothetical protein
MSVDIPHNLKGGGVVGKGSSSRAAQNNRANQMNKNNPAYASSRQSSSAANTNRSMQLNPQTETYQKSREGSSKQTEKSSSKSEQEK